MWGGDLDLDVVERDVVVMLPRALYVVVLSRKGEGSLGASRGY